MLFRHFSQPVRLFEIAQNFIYLSSRYDFSLLAIMIQIAERHSGNNVIMHMLYAFDFADLALARQNGTIMIAELVKQR